MRLYFVAIGDRRKSQWPRKRHHRRRLQDGRLILYIGRCTSHITIDKLLLMPCNLSLYNDKLSILKVFDGDGFPSL